MRRKRKVVALAAAAAAAGLAGYLVYILHVTGQLRPIEPHFTGVCVQVRGTPGAEDITLQPGGKMAYISSDDRRAAMAGSLKPGAIFGYFLGPYTGKGRLVNLTPEPLPGFSPHGIGLLARPGKPDLLFVVNHPYATQLTGQEPRGPAHTIEVFELRGERLHHLRTISDPALVSPNDVVPVGPDSFYFTNDLGSGGLAGHMMEDYLRLARAHLVHFDGKVFRVVDSGMRYANGIMVSRDRGRLFVAATTDRTLRHYKIRGDGSLERQGELHLETGVDNIEVDGEGNLWIGAHPRLLTFVLHAGDAARLAPSQVLKLSPDGHGSFRSEEVLMSAGQDLSASSVAARVGDRLLVGGVFDPLFLDCRLP